MVPKQHLSPKGTERNQKGRKIVQKASKAIHIFAKKKEILKRQGERMRAGTRNY